MSSFTAAVFLGASKYRSHSFEENPRFATSKRDFRAYVQDSDKGLNVSDELVLDLFDSPRPASSQLASLSFFLDNVSKQIPQGTRANLLVYYVGHGFFSASEEYLIAIGDLQTGNEQFTGLKVADLAYVVKTKAMEFRRFVVLDCCFAGESLKVFQSLGSEAIARRIVPSFDSGLPKRRSEDPRRGTALFCAASKDSVARAPLENERTMFTDALLDALAQGDPELSQNMTLMELSELTWERISKIRSDPVRPVLHAPDQSDGDISRNVALFPNMSYGGQAEGQKEEKARLEAERKHLEEQARLELERKQQEEQAHLEVGGKQQGAAKRSSRRRNVLIGVGCIAAVYIAGYISNRHPAPPEPNRISITDVREVSGSEIAVTFEYFYNGDKEPEEVRFYVEALGPGRENTGIVQSTHPISGKGTATVNVKKESEIGSKTSTILVICMQATGAGMFHCSQMPYRKTWQ